MDNLRVHHNKAAQVWLDAHAEQTEVFFLTSDSLKLIPD
jgi:hypothetical protein